MDNDISFLRQLLNYIDQKIAAQEQATATTTEPEEQAAEIGNANQAGVNPMDRDDIFVPPLQAKIEIMKKLSGIPLKDETLKQSQEQGGPAPAHDNAPSESQANTLKKQLTMTDLFSNDVTGD
jgi:hypothetical protein